MQQYPNQPQQWPQPPQQYPHYPQYQQPPPIKNQTMKGLSIALFVGGFIFHLLSFFPLLGFFLGIIAFFCYILAFVFLCLI